MKLFYWSLAAILWIAPGCQKSLPSGLVVLPDAKVTNSYSLKGMHRVEYQLQDKYPAEKSLKEISTQLLNRGWKPLSRFFIYPWSETSEITGWIYYRDPPKSPAWMVYAWSGDWQNANQDVVSYTLRYSDPIERYNQSVFVLKPEHNNLIVTAIYMPAAEAKRLRAEKEKAQPK